MYRVICTRSDYVVTYSVGTAHECWKRCVPPDLTHVHLKLYGPVRQQLESSMGEPILISYNEGEPLLYTYHIQRLTEGIETKVPVLPYPKIEPPTQDGEQSSTPQGITASQND
jgi:hypothetical protein